MTSRVAVIAATMGLVLGSAAQAQVLPQTSRSESTTSGINNSLSAQERNRGVVQQNQFEINSLRNQPPVQVAPPPAPLPGSR